MHTSILVELKKIVLLSFVFLLFSTAVVIGFVRQVAAQETIYIRSDGSVDPPTAPIQREGDLYTLTGNIISDVSGIVIERDNMTLNGADYRIQGTEQAYDYHFDYKGIDISGKSNITIKNTSIKGFSFGINIDVSSHNTLFGNNITNNRYGIFFSDSVHNVVFGNNVRENEYYGIRLSNSSYNIVSENEIIRNFDAGIFLSIHSSYNIISGNYISPRGGGVWIWDSNNNSFVGNVVENDFVIDFSSSSNNQVYHNNFMNEIIQVSIRNSIDNMWDNGFEGNYWGDYNEEDTDGDGLGDTPYIIDENNQDNYPLMSFLDPQELRQILYYYLLRKFNEILANHNNLNATYKELESLQTTTRSQLESTMSELDFAKNLSYVFIIATLILIASTVYLAMTKSKAKSEAKAT
jgi:parallel beta-helix repeat protein